MEAIRLILLYVHLLSMAALLGGFLTQLREPRQVTRMMVTAAVILLLTGAGLVNVRIALDLDDNHLKFATKLGITLTVLIAAWLGRRRRQVAFFYATGLLTALNVAVAVFWT
jgi:hypothetical protein